MNRNKVLIIAGALFVMGFLGFLIWLQTMAVDGKSTKTYTIEIFHCSPIDTNDIDVELIAISKSSKSGEKPSDFYIPIIYSGNISFRIPTYGMNNMRFSFDPAMYTIVDRREEEEMFTKKHTDSYEKLKAKLGKSTNCNCDSVITPLNWENNIDAFIIDNNLQTNHEKNKKYWKSFATLRGHIDSLINERKIKNGNKIRVYYCNGNGGGVITAKKIINTVDSLINRVDPPEFQKAYKYMDSCLIKDPKLSDDANFRQKYDRLKIITKINK